MEAELEEEHLQTRKALIFCKVEKAIKMAMNTGDDDDVPGDVIKLLGENGLKIVTQLITNIYETGEWPQDFTQVQ